MYHLLTFRIIKVIKLDLLDLCTLEHLCTHSRSRADVLPSNINVLHDQLIRRDFPRLWTQAHHGNVGVVFCDVIEEPGLPVLDLTT